MTASAARRARECAENAARRADYASRVAAMAIPTKTDIRMALATKGLQSEPCVAAIQNAFAGVERRGGLEKIGAEIDARIEAARARLAAKAGH